MVIISILYPPHLDKLISTLTLNLEYLSFRSIALIQVNWIWKKKKETWIYCFAFFFYFFKNVFIISSLFF